MSFYSGEAEKFNVGDLTVKIEFDPDPPNPRKDYDNLATMVAFHRRYNLGDETDYKADDYSSWDELEEAITKNEDPAVIQPLFLYDHSGLAMSTGSFRGRAPHAEWDSGQVGFIFISKEKARKEYGKLTKKNLEDARKVLEGEVETYDQYLGGQIYGYVIEDENEEELDAVWGFYGLDYVKEEARRAAEALQKKEKKKMSGTRLGESSTLGAISKILRTGTVEKYDHHGWTDLVTIDGTMYKLEGRFGIPNFRHLGPGAVVEYEVLKRTVRASEVGFWEDRDVPVMTIHRIVSPRTDKAAPRVATGTVEAYQFSMSGYQFTTIDGITYGTTWDIGDPKMRGFGVGAVVEYEVPGNMIEKYADTPYAIILRVIESAPEGGFGR